MKNLLRALALAFFAVGFSIAASAAPGTGASSYTTASTECAGLYAVSQKLFAGNAAPVADVSVASATSIQMITVTATAGTCRAVLSDADGQILRSRVVEGEADFDFYTLPTGTYRLAILDASGALHAQHTLVKR